MNGASPSIAREQTGGSSESGTGHNPYPGLVNAGYLVGLSESGQGTNPYPNFAPGFLPIPAAAFTGRLEIGDPLFVSTTDGSEL